MTDLTLHNAMADIPAALAEAIERTMMQLSDGERAQVLGLNAARVFKFAVPAGYR